MKPQRNLSGARRDYPWATIEKMAADGCRIKDVGERVGLHFSSVAAAIRKTYDLTWSEYQARQQRRRAKKVVRRKKSG